ncbi:hypothetical protein [Bacillus sp. REN16]|uniref:hypothetical protein n=1 Tax=Bacillus sp. REN16 TaxID=2887296 RepID=UPI001E2FC158|nr:hypothetical protein [Bacillus sp. REN16]MCC3359020.1 hypothetical protein [Bacillus sp. REN16]
MLRLKWEKIREQYPEQWVLVEAISAFSKNSTRYFEELSVISNFPESTIAWKEYKKLHLNDPSREYYIFHTDHETIEVKEQKFIGVRRRIQ